MIDPLFAELLPVVELHAGEAVTPLESSDEMIGSWDARLSTNGKGEARSFTRTFEVDGSTWFDGVRGRWRIESDGFLYVTFRTPPDPKYESTQDGGVVELRELVFKSRDGRLLIANEDASVIYRLKSASADP